MKIADMKVDGQLIDATHLDEAEQQKVIELLAVYGNALVAVLMTKGGAAAMQFAAGVALRMVKVNSQGLQVATLAEVRELNRGNR